MCNIILSMIPGKLMTLVELFGYKGDRKVGLELLMKAGGWVENSEDPEIRSGEPFAFYCSYFISSSLVSHLTVWMFR